jgi:uncharacterized delta-60 repeat protein
MEIYSMERSFSDNALAIAPQQNFPQGAIPADLDPTWGNAGKVSTDLSGNQPDFLTKLLVQSDGKVIATGGWKDAPTQFAAVRYNGNGTLDNTFGINGIQLVPLFANTSQDDSLTSAALQADGKIVLIGSTFPSPGSKTQVGVVRLNANGSLDNTFDGDGYVQIDASQLELTASQSSVARAVAVQADGKLAIAANISNRGDNNSHAAVIRLNSNGGLDTSFGGNGIAAFTLETAGFTTAASLLLQADGNLVVVGEASRDIATNYRSDIIAFRLLGSNGNLDSTFNGGSILTLSPTKLERNITQNLDGIGNAALQSDGKIVIVGTAADAAFSFQDTFALRLNSNGTLDNTFGGNGVVLTDVNGGDDGAVDLAIQSNGKIIVVGFADRSGSADNDALILRYAANGSLDPTWNATGKLIVDSGPSGGEQASSVVLQADGKFLVATNDGAATFGGQNFYTLRYLGDPLVPQPDLLLRNNGSGEIAIWGLNNNQIVAADYTKLANGNVLKLDSNWQLISGKSDLNGDGIRDIVWFNSATTETAIWYMQLGSNGLANVISPQSSFVYAPSNTPSNTPSATSPIRPGVGWQLAAVADLLGDGRPEFLWEDRNLGASAIWQLNIGSNGRADVNLATASYITANDPAKTPIATGGINSGWKIVGVGNFDNNTTNRDLMWFNEKTTETAIWLLNGTVVTSSGIINSGGSNVKPGLGWKPVAIGNIDGLGSDEILWQNGTAVATWALGAAFTLTAKSQLLTQSLAVGEQIQGLGDFDLSGSLDFVVRRKSGGTDRTQIYYLNASNFQLSTPTATRYITTAGQTTPLETGDARWDIADVADLGGPT